MSGFAVPRAAGGAGARSGGGGAGGGRDGLALPFGLHYSGAEPFYVGRYPDTDKYYDIQWIANPASPWEQCRRMGIA